MALWTLHGDGSLKPGAVVAPEERLGWGKMLGLGGQHRRTVGVGDRLGDVGLALVLCGM